MHLNLFLREINRLREDHDNAQRLAQGLTEIEGIHVRTAHPESNMVFFEVSVLGLNNKTFIKLLKERGVKMGAIGGGIRAVTHLDVSREDIYKAVEAITYSQKYFY